MIRDYTEIEGYKTKISNLHVTVRDLLANKLLAERQVRDMARENERLRKQVDELTAALKSLGAG